MELLTVWRKPGTGINEKCLLREDGHYIGIDSGDIYDREDYYHSKQYQAKIKSVDNENLTGMYHLYAELNTNNEENDKTFKQKYIGCYITVEKAHHFDSIQVYRCLELNEFFSEKEIELI